MDALNDESDALEKMMKGVRHHEIVNAFDEINMPLSGKLVEMLDEHFSHCTERRGCGFLQASRVLAAQVNAARSVGQEETIELLFASPSHESLQQMMPYDLKRAIGLECRGNPDFIKDDKLDTFTTDDKELIKNQFLWRQAIRHLPEKMKYEESAILANIIKDLLLPREVEEISIVSSLQEKPPVGSCTMAEKFFLDIVYGYAPRIGRINIIVDENEKPIFMEKIKIGDSYSCLSLCPLLMNGVFIPAGGLFSVQAREDDLRGVIRPCRGIKGSVMALSAYEGFRFLRITTLTVEPAVRKRAFGKLYDWQKNQNFVGYDSATLSEFMAMANKQL